MNSTDLLVLFRSEMADKAEPYLWDDEDVFGYIDDAQTMFCRETDGIADASTDDVTKLAITPGLERVSLHPSILRVRSVVREDTGREVEVLNREDMPARRWFFDGHVGPVKALVIGAEANKARLYPVPNETVNLRLEVFRMPLNRITADGDQAFEIAEEHHRHLLLWVKHLAYLKQDTETYDRMKAEEFEGKARAYFARVKEEQRRKAFKVRTVAYGGI